jgi:Bacterial protein of unknown function (HtrL_YibB).
MHNLTIVTGLFDLGREKLADGFKRDFSHYIACFEKFLKATSEYPLIVYIEQENEHVVWQHRSRENTRTVVKDLNYLRSFPFYDDVQTTRKSKKWLDQSSWLADSPQACLELYNPLVMMKQFMLNDATLFGYFDTKYFLWMDAGLSNTVNLDSYIDEDFEGRITPHMDKMLYLCFPYDSHEVHGFEKTEMDRLAGKKTQYVARGGVFGGTKSSISAVNEKYYHLLVDSLPRGYMGTEESIFTILSYKHPELCNVRMIEDNGLVYKFFEDIRQTVLRPKHVAELAIYALTFNLPKQFKMFAESFKTVYPKDFKKVKKYVINNSTDPSVEKEYAELFAEYGFEEHKFDNIGINRGRQFAADHFLGSQHDYMIFFEDDMLLHPKGAPVCQSGMGTYQPNLFDSCLDIMKMEKLDYLKLSFTEFYGINAENWAWYNVPLDRKESYFPTRSDGVDAKKTKIDYIGVHRRIPYAIGEFHYCNWPVIFTKKGTQVVFKEIQYANPFEQTWMSQTFMHMRDGKLKVGCLLASPINHHRKYHYDGKTRREN